MPDSTIYTSYSITTSTIGGGQIDYSRQQTNPNIVTFTVIPNTHKTFSKYIIEGYPDDYSKLITNSNEYIIGYDGDNIVATVGGHSEDSTTPLTLTLNRDVSVTAVFVDQPIIHIDATANIRHASVYVSNNDEYDELTAILWARPFPDYIFVKWDDGNIENPRQVTVDKSTTFKAIYQKIVDTNAVYQYRGFIKDQMYLTDKPKAFVVIDYFDLKIDKLTKATASFNVYNMPKNIDDGDILVVYDPMGTVLYNGVINSIQGKIIRTSNMESFYKGEWIYNIHPSTYLEDEIAWLLREYSQGKIYKSSWVDPQVAQRLGGITIRTIGDNFSPSISVKLPSDLNDQGTENLTQYDMETFIYELYEKYNVIFDFTINFEGENFVDIKVPNYTKIKVGNNMYGIQNMSPVTTVEETNKLIIFSMDKIYRTTYIATKNDIVKQPSSTANRFNITNTKIVFSDDAESDLVASNLPTTMYNHKLTFDLIVKNFVYQFGDFNLGGELDIYDGDDYYDSVLTGYEISKASNQNITKVKFVCGKIRNKLTQMLTLKKV